jgi:hypothetical protein
LYKPQMIDEGDCGATGGMKIGRGNRSTRRKHFTLVTTSFNELISLTALHSLSLSLSLSLWLYSPLDLGRFFQFLNLYTVSRTPWTGDQPVARPLPTYKTTQTQNKRIQTSMLQVGFEPTIPAFGRAKNVHALDRAVTVIGYFATLLFENCLSLFGSSFLNPN